eukprot:UN09389
MQSPQHTESASSYQLLRRRPNTHLYSSISLQSPHKIPTDDPMNRKIQNNNNNTQPIDLSLFYYKNNVQYVHIRSE